ncbi:MAG: phage baseplate assembly protein V [Actinomycetota bacterium]
MIHTHAAPTSVGVTYYGLYPATVRALEGDPEGRQRIQVELPWLATTDGDEPPRAWAVLISPYADADQGIQMLPEIDSTVVVGFLAGHLDHPYVVGAVWNGNAAPPEEFSDANDKRVIKTRSGSMLEFDDTEGAVAIRITTPGGHEVVMDDAGQSVLISASSGAKMELTQAGGVTIEAASTVDVTAALVTVDAAMSQFNGTVTCDTLIAKSGGVVSPMYTPGAGNIW